MRLLAFLVLTSFGFSGFAQDNIRSNSLAFSYLAKHITPKTLSFSVTDEHDQHQYHYHTKFKGGIQLKYAHTATCFHPNILTNLEALWGKEQYDLAFFGTQSSYNHSNETEANSSIELRKIGFGLSSEYLLHHKDTSLLSSLTFGTQFYANRYEVLSANTKFTTFSSEGIEASLSNSHLETSFFFFLPTIQLSAGYKIRKYISKNLAFFISSSVDFRTPFLFSPFKTDCTNLPFFKLQESASPLIHFRLSIGLELWRYK